MTSFRRLLASLAVSSLGDWLYNVALLAFVFERTGSPTWLAVTTAVRVLPIVVLGPVGGVLADRYDRRRLIIASDLVRAALMVALAAVVAFGLPVVLAPLLAAAATLVSSVHPPAVAASTPRLVDADALQRANAARAAIGQAAIVAGPALGAGVLAVSSPAVAILANAATFLISAVLVATIPGGPAFRPSRGGGAADLLGDLRAGVGRAARRARRGARDRRRHDLQRRLRDPHRDARAGGRPRRRRRRRLRAAARGVRRRRHRGRGRGRPARRRSLARHPGGRARAAGAAGCRARRRRHAVGRAPARVVGGSGAVVAEVLSETALPRMLDDAVLARAYGIMLPVTLSGIVAGSLVAGPLVALLGVSGALITTGAAVLALAALLLRRPLIVGAPAVTVPA